MMIGIVGVYYTVERVRIRWKPDTVFYSENHPGVIHFEWSRNGRLVHVTDIE